MKIAISTDSGRVSQHFGRCPQFTIVSIENNKLLKKEVIDNPGHSTGSLPKYFNEIGVNCVIAGGAGRRAQNFFKEYNIELILGISGNIENVINNLLEGSLKGGESSCSPGKGRGYGFDKEDGHHH
ncbi:NifB/NifX family molybdenum-iron cluster-binding protein [Candidatus Woesearchaeota archaeon]|nr:NifB/NifX family molybdenum-iron cluster-binding protein [Candidatus Woesearchaeota archaeon]